MKYVYQILVLLISFFLCFGCCNKKVMKKDKTIFKGKILQAWLYQLKNNDPDKRKEAANALGAVGSRVAVRALIRVVKQDENDEVREYAAYALFMAKESTSICAIKKLIEKEKKREVLKPLYLLLFERDKSALGKALKNKDAYTRRAMVKFLGRMKLKTAVPALIKALLEDPEAMVRVEAAEALAIIREKKTIPVLLKALKDKSQGVRIYAGIALHLITGQPQHEDVAKWQKWWEKNKDRILKEEAEKERLEKENAEKE